MRNAARLKMAYCPLPETEGVKLRCLLSFPEPASVIDPCVGQGTALELVTCDAPVRRYGVELDAERARIASSKGIETIQGNTFDAIAKPESFSLLYLNPPYDSENWLHCQSAHGGCVSGTYLPLAGDGRRSHPSGPIRAIARLFRHPEFPFCRAERFSYDRRRFGPVQASCGLRCSPRGQRRSRRE
jgi:hypothetical protein